MGYLLIYCGIGLAVAGVLIPYRRLFREERMPWPVWLVLGGFNWPFLVMALIYLPISRFTGWPRRRY